MDKPGRNETPRREGGASEGTMTFIKRKGRTTFSVGKRGPRMSYRLGCAVPILAMLLLAALLTACGGSAATPTPEARTITGTFTLISENGWRGEGCRGDGGYSDIAKGLQATLSDETGTIIASNTFGVGLTQEDITRCEWTYEFSDVPEAEFYTVTVGKRGELTYSFAEMESMGWQVASTLGP